MCCVYFKNPKEVYLLNGFWSVWPLWGDVIHWSLKLRQAATEVSLEHPTACYWHLLKPMRGTFIIINAQWTVSHPKRKVPFAIKSLIPDSQNIWEVGTSGAPTLEKDIMMLLCATNANWFSWAGDRFSQAGMGCGTIMEYRCTGPGNVIQVLYWQNLQCILWLGW